MFITTSRKPSSRTRSFCQSLSRALNTAYVNRGKMSFRDVLVKASDSGYEKIAIVSQIKGNPSRIEIFDKNGEIRLFLKISMALFDLNGRVNPDKLRLRCEIDDLTDTFMDILDIPKSQEKTDNNLIWIKKGDGENKALIEFYDKDGFMRDPKIYVKNWRFE
ncbi:Brix domain-containing protein [Methanobacterium oryzae]|uniref:Brix domain-containing protein n=1 Tax=Methanobacterium oryzae TaxID=69540 RepID=UPI003D1CEF6C